jgi:type I restriction enzyme R subunit
VEAIDEEEVMNAPQRINNVVDYIITNHDRKTHNRSLTAIFCVSIVPILIEYYTLFQQKKVAGEHNLKVAIIFSYGANVDLIDNGEEFEEDWEEREFGVAADLRREDYTKSEKKHPREYLDEFMADYNATFTTNCNTKDSKLFYQYYNNLADRVKKKQIDILLVVNMFLTGFDSKWLNTLYVDKNLKYHGLIPAYSRANRILDEIKSRGNIVCFRNLKPATDDAITLFSNINAKDEIIIQPYEDYVEKFQEAVLKLLEVVPTVKLSL